MAARGRLSTRRATSARGSRTASPSNAAGLTFTEALREWRLWVLGIVFIPISFAVGGPIPNMENILSLPKIEGTEGSERPVLSLTQAPSGVEGEGSRESVELCAIEKVDGARRLVAVLAGRDGRGRGEGRRGPVKLVGGELAVIGDRMGGGALVIAARLLVAMGFLGRAALPIGGPRDR